MSPRILLTRREARRLRVVFRRPLLGIALATAAPPLVLDAAPGRLWARLQHEGLLVATAATGVARPAGAAVALPLDALIEVEGDDPAPVLLEMVAAGWLRVRWEVGGIAQERGFAVPPLATLPPPPAPPTATTRLPPPVWAALASAVSDPATSPGFGVLLRLGGAAAAVVSGDARRIALPARFRFPWDDPVLVAAPPLLGCPALRRHRRCAVGRSDTHVLLRAGGWTILLAIVAARPPGVA